MKSVGTMISPYLSSSMRFFLGILLLLVIQRIQTGRVHLTLTGGMVVWGGFFKALHYLGENYGVMNGFSYGGVLVWPVQTLAVLLVSVFILKEKLTLRMAVGTVLCVLGIMMVAWNGAPMEIFLGSQVPILAAFVIAGIGSAGFSFAQKKLLNTMDAVELNSSMFTFGWLATLIVLIPTGPHMTGPANAAGIICMLILGAITCVGFLLQAAALKTIPVLVATIIQSSTVILTILWGVLFYGDPISGWVISGTIMFVGGILAINLRKKA